MLLTGLPNAGGRPVGGGGFPLQAAAEPGGTQRRCRPRHDHGAEHDQRLGYAQILHSSSRPVSRSRAGWARFAASPGDVDWKLEVVVVPVADVERAKAFYAGQLGFVVDHDTQAGEGVRVVQLTPPGSACSIVVGEGIAEMEPGSLRGLQLVVDDVRAARAELAGRGVEVSEVQVFAGTGFRAARDGDELQNAGFAFFSDPDGNAWAVQQISRG